VPRTNCCHKAPGDSLGRLHVTVKLPKHIRDRRFYAGESPNPTRADGSSGACPRNVEAVQLAFRTCRLDLNVLNLHGTRFAKERSRREQPRNDSSEAAERQIFWNDLFAVFGRRVQEVGRFERAAQRLSTGRHGWIDLLVPGEMAVEHKAGVRNLDHAMTQLFDYLDDLPSAAAPWLSLLATSRLFTGRILRRGPKAIHSLRTARARRTLLVLADTESPRCSRTKKRPPRRHGLHGDTSHAVLASGYDPHALREWLTRILFCLFRDNTNVGQGRVPPPRSPQHQPGRLGPRSTLAYLFQLLKHATGTATH